MYSFAAWLIFKNGASNITPEGAAWVKNIFDYSFKYILVIKLIYLQSNSDRTFAVWQIILKIYSKVQNKEFYFDSYNKIKV